MGSDVLGQQRRPRSSPCRACRSRTAGRGAPGTPPGSTPRLPSALAMPSIVRTVARPRDRPRSIDAGLDRRAVDVDDAGAALRRVAADVRAGQAEVVAQELDEQRAALDGAVHGATVHCQALPSSCKFLPEIRRSDAGPARTLGPAARPRHWTIGVEHDRGRGKRGARAIARAADSPRPSARADPAAGVGRTAVARSGRSALGRHSEDAASGRRRLPVRALPARRVPSPRSRIRPFSNDGVARTMCSPSPATQTQRSDIVAESLRSASVH